MRSAVIGRLAAFGEAAAASLPAHVAGRIIAHGWATVDLDRAVQELGEALGIPPERFTVAADAQLIGARCRVADAVLPDGSSLAILEPTTEGRLAATLARVGEGPAAVWLVAASDGSAAFVAGRAARAGRAVDASGLPIATSSERDGPFGVERLVLGGPTHGPHRLLVGLPGTIR